MDCLKTQLHIRPAPSYQPIRHHLSTTAGLSLIALGQPSLYQSEGEGGERGVTGAGVSV